MLLKILDAFKAFVATDATTDIPPAIALALPDVETTYLLPLLGRDLLRWLQAQVDAPGFDPDADTLVGELRRLVQAPLARLAASAGVTPHQATIDNTGVHILSTETSKTAFQWQVSDLQTYLLDRGHGDLDTLQQWLEDNYPSSPELQAWASSPAGQRHRRELFTCTADFQEWQNIGASRRVFLALGPIRRREESFTLGPRLGAEFLQELRDQVRDRALTSENENLLRAYVYPALSSLTVAAGIAERVVRLCGGDLVLATPATDDATLQGELNRRAGQALTAGRRWLADLSSYLDRTASATKYATYFHSSAYTPPTPPPAPTNTPDSRIFKLIG